MPSLRQQWDATKAAWDDDTSNASPGARFGLMFDPLAYIFGDKYRKEITKHGDKANLELSKLLGTDDRGGWAANKPASTLGLMAAAYYGGGALMGGGGAGGSAGGSGQGLGLFSNGGQGGLQGLGGGNAGALAQSGGIGGGAGMGAAGTGAGPAQLGMGGGGWQQQLQSMMGQGGFGSMPGMSTGVPPQQQATPPPQPMGAPNNIQAQPIDQTQLNKGMPAGVKLSRGLGSLRDALTPIDPRMAEGMDPNHVKALRNQAMLRMGLGMMANANQGGRFGEALAAGLGMGVGGFNKDIEGTYQRGVEARELKRDEDRIALQDKRYDAQIARQNARDDISDKQWKDTFDATQEYRKSSLESLERRAAAKVPGTTMNEEAVDLAAARIVNGEKARDVLANFGRGAQGAANITAVQNRVAAMAKERGMSPAEFAVANQEVAAESRMRLELGAREGKIASRVEEAKQFAKIAGEASLKVPRGTFVPVSKLLQYKDTQLSSPELAAFKAANVSLINAYAAAVGGGVPTVHDKEAAEAMLSTAQSPEAYQAVVNQLITEMDAALQAPRSVMEEMRRHDLGLGHPPAPANSGGWSIKPVN